MSSLLLESEDAGFLLQVGAAGAAAQPTYQVAS
jgi:hypothetical protein